jgi:FAD:protein FMN transferase
VKAITRRDWLKTGAAGLGAAMLGTAGRATSVRSTGEAYSFHHDYVIGTSLDLHVVASDDAAATAAERAALDEIERLRLVLSVYDPASELSRVNRLREPVAVSSDLAYVLRAYEQWSQATGGAFNGQLGELTRVWKEAEHTGEFPQAVTLERIARELRSPGWRLDSAAGAVQRTTDQPLDLNALGKVYIIGKVVEAMRIAAPAVTGLLVNLGGDIFAWGVPPGANGWAIGIQNPHDYHDNSAPIAGLWLANQAVASSGGYQRFYVVGGQQYSHVLNPWTGRPATGVAGATVVAPDNLTANALATALCVLPPDEGLRLVASVPGTECLIVADNGSRFHSPNLKLLEIARVTMLAPADEKGDKEEKKGIPWPKGFQLTVKVELPQIEAAKYRRPYTAIWIEDDAGKAVRTLAVWGSAPKYLKDLSDWWKIGKGDADLVKAVARATRGPGKYSLVWDGKDHQGNVLPQGTYTVRVEVHREHGSHLRQSGRIECKEDGARVTLERNEETNDTVIDYGKKKQP